jgi:hypothetical protein
VRLARGFTSIRKTSPSLTANWTFIRPFTPIALASATVSRRSSSTMSFGQGVRRQGAGAVAGVHAGFLDMLHDAGHPNVFAIADRVDVDLRRVGQIAVQQQRG